MIRRHFASFTDTRTHLRDVLDAARSGRVATIARGGERFAVIDTDVLLAELALSRPSQAVVAAEGGGWSAFVPGIPTHGEGDTLDAAIDDLVDALRDYAEDWNDHLLGAPNHHDNWAVVTLVELSSDDQLRTWILAPSATPVR